jgi:tripartite-type tricarboxylate transporter receptor subunit TctC
MKFLVMLFLSLFNVFAMAKDYTLIIPNTAGSVSDLVGRSIAEIYQKNTGNRLIIQNIGGGQQVPAAVKFATANSPTIIMSTTGILVFNPVLNKNLPYDLNAFDHVGGISFSPIIWVVRTESSYQNMQDLVDKLPQSTKPLVAYANLVEVVNLSILEKKFNWPKGKVESVKYRGVPEAIQGLISGDLDVAVVSTTQVVNSFVESGRLRVIGTTIDVPFQINNVTALPVRQQLGVEQFTGGNFLSLNKHFSLSEATHLKQELYKILNDPVFKENLRKFGSIPFENNNSNQNLINFVNSFRSTVSSMNLQVQ